MSDVRLERVIMSGTTEDKDQVVFNPGDVIQGWEEPFAKVLNDDLKGRRCDNCFKEGLKLHRCAGCKRMYYCDRKCQSKDWKYAHLLECKSTYFQHPEKAGNGGSSQFQRQMSRLYAILKLQEDRSYTMYDGTTRSCKDLVSHQEKLEFDPTYQNNILIILMRKLLEPNVEGNAPPDMEIVRPQLPLLFRIAGLWKTNAVELLNEKQNMKIGSAIFIQGSYFDHSCRPTAILNFKGIRAEVRAIAPIKRGERPYVTYLAGHRGRAERALQLMIRYHFQCQCTLCTEEANGDVISYVELEALRHTPNEVTWKAILDLGKQELKLMRKCYVEYDERITNKLFVLFQEVASLGAPKRTLKRLANDAVEHLKITFGPECGDLVTLHALRPNYGIM